MKKILFVSILISTSALALGIDINTKIKWNSIVVVAAAHDVGLNAEYDTHPEVSSTYYRILGDLLERDKFSVADAVSVCNQECNKSAFLREGRGQSGKKCPEICKSFGNALIEENNKKTYALQLDDEGYVYDSRGRIYTHDKEFYADETETMYSGKENGFRDDAPCYTAIFEAKTNKKIAVCAGTWSEDGASEESFSVIDAKYKDYTFTLNCSGNWVWNESASCSLWADSPQIRQKQEYETLYESARKCATSLNGVSLDDVLSAIIQNENYGYILSDGVTKLLSQTFDSIDFVSIFTRFTPTSYDMYNSLKFYYDTYCPITYSNYKNGEEFISQVNKAFKRLAYYFQTRGAYFANRQVKSLNEAKEDIASTLELDVFPFFNSIKLSNNMQCSGDCNKFGQDYVTCTLGPLTGTFEFDDICQSKMEGFLNNMF